jgi:Lon protease-like protein
MNGLHGMQRSEQVGNERHGSGGGSGYDKPPPPLPGHNGLDAFRDAREIVRLVQCTACSLPLRHPIALPCGNIICRGCLPATHTRRGISFPDTPGRQEGFLCPFEDCVKEHPVADCGVDITLGKVLDVMERHLEDNLSGGGSGTRFGRLGTTYALARTGQLPYEGELTYVEEASDGTDEEVLQVVRDLACSEMECQVCYGLLFDPVTTHCGHTFCRKCLQRVLDHSQLCPSCRQRLQLPSVLPAKSSNKRLTEILVAICPEALALRAAAVASEDRPGSDDELSTPIFVCASSFPTMPTPLFIFEPRYRLMIRRALESDRKFGMVLPNPTCVPQEDIGQAPFMQYGTMLRIENFHIYPDGRSHIWTVGVSKFKIKKWGLRDDYVVANVERIDDVPLAEEEALEALDTTRLPSPSDPPQSPWATYSTRELLEICHGFVDHMQAMAAPWMNPNNLAMFGPRPDNPATFPYWLASVLPIADTEKYRLITERSVRGRLLITVGWIKKVERHRW